MSKRRVVITGMGCVTPLGMRTAAVWENLLEGKSGLGPITLFDASHFDVRIAGEVRDFNPLDYMDTKEARRTDRFSQFAIAALDEACRQSRLLITPEIAFDVGAVLGSGVGGIDTYTQDLAALNEKGPRRVSPFLIPSITVDVPSVLVALQTGAQGPNFGVSSACATSTDAIGQAYEAIIGERALAMFTGGFEAAVTPIGIAAFDRMRALSHQNENPQAASRPFDAARDGFVMGEGGGLLIIEELEFALRRGAQPLAEILGYASTSDAVHLAAPDSDGSGAAQCIRLALKYAGLQPQEVSYINAHGTSTPLGDRAETLSIKQALGEHAYRVPVSSTKSMTGHLLGGAGAVEAIICVQALGSGMIPATTNLDTPDPACDLDYVPNHARSCPDINIALSNSFGFGGHNSTLVIGKYPSYL